MVIAVVLITSSMILLLGLMAQTMAGGKSGNRDLEQWRAFYLAEAGITESMAAIRAGGTGGIGSEARPAALGGGLLWATATDAGDGVTRVVVTAMAGGGRCALEAYLRAGSSESQMFDMMIFSKDTLSIDSNQLIDSYDSSLGTYASQAVNTLSGVDYANTNGDLGSNDSIRISSNTLVMGDATPGPSGSVSLDSGVHVEGSTLSATSERTMEPLTRPDVAGGGNMTISGTTSIGPGTIGYGSLKLGSSSTLVVTGPAEIAVLGKMEVGEDATLEIDATDGPVTFYVNGTFKYNEDAHISTSSGSPADVVFAFDSGNPIRFPAGIDFFGAIYAPNAPISIDSNSEFWGAIVAESITMSSGTKFHFDEYLLTRTMQSEGDANEVSVLYWGRTSVPDQAYMSDRRDPFRLLGVDKGDLPQPHQAWQAAD